MAKTDRRRIDYMPGPAAQQALDEAAKSFRDLATQALIDRLVITAVSALAHAHWQPPALFGRNRDKWRLPSVLKAEEQDHG